MSLFKTRIYLDYAAATPVRAEAKRAMKKYASDAFHNPSAIYTEGREAKHALEAMRTRAARALSVSHRDIIFTSGGTESDNLAILGIFEAAREHIERPHIVTLATEHPAILEAVHEAGRRGADITLLEPDDEGFISAEAVRNALRETTVLIALSYASSETGTVAPIAKIGRIVREYRKERGKAYPYLHVDASQAVRTLRVDPEAIHADTLALDGAKIYGPKGVGALVVRPAVTLRPMLMGGGQERGLRSGTENMPGIAGFVEALCLAIEEKEAERERMQALKDRFIELVLQIPNVVINGRVKDSLPQIVSITVPEALHEYLAIKLDRRGVLVSTGSSCSSRKNEADKEALRFSFGRETTTKDIEIAARNLAEILL